VFLAEAESVDGDLGFWMWVGGIGVCGGIRMIVRRRDLGVPLEDVWVQVWVGVGVLVWIHFM